MWRIRNDQWPSAVAFDCLFTRRCLLLLVEEHLGFWLTFVIKNRLSFNILIHIIFTSYLNQKRLDVTLIKIQNS